MFDILRTTDEELVYDCVTRKENWGMVTDDGAPSRELYFPNMSPSVYWLRVMYDDESLGVFCAAPHGCVCYEVHAALSPAARGIADMAARAAIDWMFHNTHAESLIAWIPEYNDLAYELALKSGMKVIGKNTKSFKKNNKLYDETLFAVARGE